MAVRLLPKTIRGQLALLVLGVALPLAALIGYNLYDRARDEFADAEALARRLAEANADRAAEYVNGLRVTLEAVARRPLVRAMNASRCDPNLPDLADLYPRASNFGVVNLEGLIICSSRPLPSGRPVRMANEELLREMLAEPRFRMSKPVVSRVTGRWIVGAVQPVTGENGALAGMVGVTAELSQWRPFLPPESLPAGAVITVVTSDGTIIARSADAGKWISRKLWDEEITTHVLEKKEGVLHAKGPDGADRVFGFKPVSGLPWFVLAGIPEGSVYGPARERLVETGALLALVVLAVLALAWWFGASLARPIRQVARAARAGADGAHTEVPIAGPEEIAEVAREFNRMVEAYAAAARSRDQLNRELESRVRERTAQLEDANRELEAFSYSVSHDLRAPVRHIDGFLNLLERELPPLEGKAAHYLATIAASSRKMGALIDDLLALSRTARAPLQAVEFELRPLIDEVLRELRPDLAERKVEWRIAALPAVRGDRALLRVLLHNLLANALKYTRPREAAVIEIGAERLASGETAVYVRDNGVGFDMRYSNKLFGVFQRLHRDDEFEGTGIGLATARRVAHRHGARIWGEGEPGRGATFRFTVAPAAEAA